MATPGRLLDLEHQNAVDLSKIEILVLDEADRMLDMGFIHDIRRVLAKLPAKRQNLLFSATFSDDIKALANKLLHNPASVEVARRNTASEQIEQSVHFVDKKRKRELLSQMIGEGDWKQVLVFTRTKHGANHGGAAEQRRHHRSGDPRQQERGARTRALADFKDGRIRVLVATDIAARGLDIDQLPHVVNYELPNVPEDYVHRIGRTGRAERTGEAISLVCVDEHKLLRDIERLLKREIPRIALPGYDRIRPSRPSRSSTAAGAGAATAVASVPVTAAVSAAATRTAASVKTAATATVTPARRVMASAVPAHRLRAAHATANRLNKPDCSKSKPPIRAAFGSSRFTGERCFDFQEEVSVIPVSIGHPLHHFYLIVHPFQHAGIQPVSGTRDDATGIPFQFLGEVLQRLDSAFLRLPVPAYPASLRLLFTRGVPQFFQRCFHQPDHIQRLIRLQQLRELYLMPFGQVFWLRSSSQRLRLMT